MVTSRCRAIVAGLLALCAAAAQADPPMALYYNERPPYLVTVTPFERVTGLTANPAAQAFRGAGLVPRWTPMPTSRQLASLKDSDVPACAVGWFKNPEREALFKFTKAIYRDKPTVALARSGFMPGGTKLADVLRQPGVRVMVKDRYSYGPVIDALVKEVRPDTIATTEENVQMLRMIAGQRADFMFAAEEEAAYLVEQAGVEASAVKILRFSDVPPGEKRYILCSKAVSDAVIDRLNRAIDFE